MALGRLQQKHSLPPPSSFFVACHLGCGFVPEPWPGPLRQRRAVTCCFSDTPRSGLLGVAAHCSSVATSCGDPESTPLPALRRLLHVLDKRHASGPASRLRSHGPPRGQKSQRVERMPARQTRRWPRLPRGRGRGTRDPGGGQDSLLRHHVPPWGCGHGQRPLAGFGCTVRTGWGPGKQGRSAAGARAGSAVKVGVSTRRCAGRVAPWVGPRPGTPLAQLRWLLRRVSAPAAAATGQGGPGNRNGAWGQRDRDGSHCRSQRAPRPVLGTGREPPPTGSLPHRPPGLSSPHARDPLTPQVAVPWARGVGEGRVQRGGGGPRRGWRLSPPWGGSSGGARPRRWAGAHEARHRGDWNEREAPRVHAGDTAGAPSVIAVISATMGPTASEERSH